MATNLNRITFVVTPEMEPLIDEAKRMYYDKTLSDMLRALFIKGLEAVKAEKRDESA